MTRLWHWIKGGGSMWLSVVVAAALVTGRSFHVWRDDHGTVLLYWLVMFQAISTSAIYDRARRCSADG